MTPNEIQYPTYFSEFEIQAEIYHRLKERGHKVRGNVKARCIDGGKRPRVYFDLVVFGAYEQPLVIVECKNIMAPSGNETLGGRQLRRYSKFSVPIVACFNMETVDQAISEVEGHIELVPFS